MKSNCPAGISSVTSCKKTIRKKWLTHFIILLTLMPLLNSNTFTHDTLSSNTSLLTPNLQHEPIQPLRQPENLNPSKVTLGEALFHDGSIETLKEAIKLMAKHQPVRVISDQDSRYIVAFLKTLPGEYKGQSLADKYLSQKRDDTP